ncbi:histidine phosphatase family protein [Flexivirga sp. B27]
MRLLLIRHAEIPPNVEGRLETSVPGPSLTDTGRSQARELADRLAPEGIGHVFRSPMVRTEETITPFLERSGLQARVLDVGEIEAGDYEGHTDALAHDAYHQVIFGWADGRHEESIPGGHDGSEFFARFDASIEQATAGMEGTVAVVSHGAALRTWTAARCVNLDHRFVAARPIPNTGVIELQPTSPDGGWRCVSWVGQPIAELDSAPAND